MLVYTAKNPKNNGHDIVVAVVQSQFKGVEDVVALSLTAQFAAVMNKEIIVQNLATQSEIDEACRKNPAMDSYFKRTFGKK